MLLIKPKPNEHVYKCTENKNALRNMILQAWISKLISKFIFKGMCIVKFIYTNLKSSHYFE